ncbi:GspH family T2SS minor pseudopilin variant LspH [Legionella maioricensis]|uniref:Type II secretion system protein H n=1 Tax=Legionella maioricensis TaxID=2896528 RepID=A0A9X2D2R7_9GAMM|nr:GspH family T2SS minor pseudopilin variant LspH [Legionella maioricensis]MCL9684612.1 GspH family T2SS minor pseudopilin variant LspH [Legionella maioricensis]MCL9687392.1 GspH family T2SS minor pseudopilin variant LspH [Legionella maioricensis]
MITNRGFTLIEILIVIVIIGITVGFALITFGDFGESRRILFSVDQLVNALKLAQQQAILETSTLGLRINNNSYQILRFQNASNWEPISNKGIFKVTYFPKNTVIILKTNNKPLPGSPSIIINSSGDMTPFTLSFGTNKEMMTTLKGSHNGNLIFSTAKIK